MNQIRYVTLEEVQKHTVKEDCWTIVHGKVYDITKYISRHPGGVRLIMKNAGGDSSQDFEAMEHSKNARTILAKFYIADLEPSTSESSQLLAPTLPAPIPAPAPAPIPAPVPPRSSSLLPSILSFRKKEAKNNKNNKNKDKTKKKSKNEVLNPSPAHAESVEIKT